jgi:hypothetical protein
MPAGHREAVFRSGRTNREFTMTTLATKLKSTAFAALAVTVISGGATTFSVTEAEAQWRPGVRFGGGWAPRAAYRGGWGYRPVRGFRGGRGAAVAAGIIGGIAAGALIAGASQPAYAAPAYGYGHGGYAPAYNHYQPAYSYHQPVYGYQPTCYTKRVRQVIDYDTVVIRRVRVCE